MIHCFDADDLRLEPAIVLVQMRGEFDLRRRRPDEKQGIDIDHRARDVTKEALCVIRELSLASPRPFGCL